VTRVFALAPPEIAELSGLSLHDEIESAEVVLLGPRHGANLLEALPRARALQWVHATSAGVETLPLAELAERGITVTNGAGLYGDALAEFAIAGMLWFAKDLRRLDRNQSARRWEPFYVERLEGKRAGIIGMGGIGKAVAQRASAMHMRVIATRAHSIEEILSTCDYVVLCTPLTTETRSLLSRDRLRLMADHAVLINLGRGAVVDEAALIDELRRIRGAALDVFETEPLPESSPLWGLENVLISPHSADRTQDSHKRAVAFFLENLRRYQAGQPLENVVDPARGY
jgi:phosphoglycerate dehydrogenase-like enzyme